MEVKRTFLLLLPLAFAAILFPGMSQGPLNHLVGNVGGGEGKPNYHIVKKGETLYAISKSYGVEVDSIKTWNQLLTNELSIGAKLYVERPGKEDYSNQEMTITVTKATAGQGNDSEISTTTEVVSNDPGEMPRIRKKPGTHVVRSGETLFGIAKMYGMDIKEIKSINRLDNNALNIGQELQVLTLDKNNPNQGTPLYDAITESEMLENPEPVQTETREMKVLTVEKKVKIPEGASANTYHDNLSGKTFQRVLEKGHPGKIMDYSTDQTRFYGFHKELPAGSYIRVDYPDKAQSILVEIIGTMPGNDPNVIRLTTRCWDYLGITSNENEVQLRYVIPE